MGFTTEHRAGYGAAMSWLLFMLIVVFSLVNFLLVRRSVTGVGK